MTRDEFIDGYLNRSGMSKYRTPDGFHVPGTSRRFALPCHCGEEGCEGWAMISEDFVEEHKRRNADSGEPNI